MELPLTGKSEEEVLNELESYRENDLDWRSGKVFGYVFHPGREAEELLKQAYMKYINENCVDPTIFPSVVRMETEVIRIVANLLRGDENVVGNLTTGGTESILLAVKSARDKALSERPGLQQPEIVLSVTGHPAFHKAAKYMGLNVVVTEMDSSFRSNPEAMRRVITDNTILLVASAPSYAHGVVDPVTEIGQLALEHDLMLHVDACMGGIMLSIMRDMKGYSAPDFDFSVPGVTSMSADMHKFGYALKGASTVIYRNKEIRKHQLYTNTATTTYALLNPTLLSSRSAGPAAAAWTALNHFGRSGYEKIYSAVMEATRKMISGINATGDLRVLGEPDMCIFSITSDTINVYQLADEMLKKGWYLQPQRSTEQDPPGIHFTVNYNSVPLIDEFLEDLPPAIEAVKKNPEKIDIAAVRSQVKSMLDSFGDDAIDQLKSMAGVSGSDLPGNMALVNSLLDSLPPHISEPLLVQFLNDLYR